jgi:hypothetical protein
MDTAAFLPSEESEREGIHESSGDEPIPSTKEARIAALQDKLREALDKEEYERAAKIRDDIKKLTSNN